MTKDPWMKWYPADWRSEPRLRMCSLAARGLWADMISYMHEGSPYGHLTIDDAQPDMADIAALVSRPLAEVRKAFAELEARQVFSWAESGAIYSRRMVRDKAKSEADKANGKAGGNPKLMNGVNPPDKPPDKAHIPETRNHKLERNLSNGVKAKRWTPPRHGANSTKAGRIYVENGSPEWTAYAEDFKQAHGVEPVPNENGGKWFRTLGEASK